MQMVKYKNYQVSQPLNTKKMIEISQLDPYRDLI